MTSPKVEAVTHAEPVDSQPHEAMEKSSGDPGDPPRVEAKPLRAPSRVAEAVIQTAPTLERPKLSKEEIAELAKEIAKEMPGTTVTETTKDQVAVHLCSSSTGFTDCTDSELVAWGIGLASKIHDLGDRWRTETVRYREEHKSQSTPDFYSEGVRSSKHSISTRIVATKTPLNLEA